MEQYIYQLIAIAGTFDRLHKGHRFFISQAFKLGEKVIIGLTSDEYVEEKLSVKAESDKDTSGVARKDSPDGGGIRIKVNNYEMRKKELEDFLKEENLLNRAEIVKIDDIYGPAAEETEIEALAVTRETLGGASLVNRKRRLKDLKPLKILKIPLIPAEDRKRIASTRIRLGEIDRWGRVFESRMTNNESRISDELRQELKKPLGELIRGDPNNLLSITEKLKKAVGKTNSIMISTVGDEVTKICNETGIPIHLAIFDYRVGRVKKYYSLADLGFVNGKARKTPATNTPERWPYGLLSGGGTNSDSREVEESLIRVNNPPGHITKELVSAVKNAYFGIIKDNKQRIIKVEGEEDLAGVPAVLLAPLGTLALYGQPGEGVVVVEVTEEMKQTLLRLVKLY